MASMVFNKALSLGFNELTSATLKLALVQSSVPLTDPDAAFVADLASGWELTAASGYSRATLASKTTTVDNANNRANIDAADVNFPSITTPGSTVGGVLIYKHVTDDSDSIPLYYNEWNAAQTISGSFDVVLNPLGIATAVQG